MEQNLYLRILISSFLLFSLIWFDLFSQSANSNSKEPKIFLPDLTSEIPHVRDMTISQDGSEAYFTVESHKRNISFIVRIEKEGTEWTEPEVASFSGKYRDIEPHLSLDGLQLYFASNRPTNGTGEIKDYDIWITERQRADDVWATPRNLGPEVNSKGNEYYPSVSSKGNLYFTAELPDSKGREDIYVSHYDGQHYLAPVSLSDSINSEFYEFNAFIDPNESFIIFTCYGRSDGQGGGDLYISRRTAAGEWKSAQNMGPEINSVGLDYCPFVDPGKSMLYFTSDRSSVKRSYAEPLKYREFLTQVNQHQNGRSRIYYVDFSKFAD